MPEVPREKTSRCEAYLEKAKQISRHHNVYHMGLREGFKQDLPMEKLEADLITAVFPSDSLLADFQVEKAHQVPSMWLPVGNPPRTVLVNLLSFKHWAHLLQLSLNNRDASYQADSLNFYEDQALQNPKPENGILGS